MMKWLVSLCILAGIQLSVTSMVSALPSSSIPSGTCASINYTNSCCPPRNNCQATDGNCHCGADCHAFGNCCVDAHCPSQPRTCADVGITTCCNDPNGAGYCDVYHRPHDNNSQYRCSCNVSCHLRNDCCSDAGAIGCIPRTCSEAGKSAGSCISLSSSKECYVPGGQCYCDSVCTTYNDCCDDVNAPPLPYYHHDGTQQSLKQKLRDMFLQQFKESNLMNRAQTSNTRYVYNGMVPVARARKARQNPKKF